MAATSPRPSRAIAAIGANRNAVGTVKLKDVRVKISGHDVDIVYEGTLITASYAMGHGILAPRGAIEIANGTGTTPTVTSETTPSNM